MRTSLTTKIADARAGGRSPGSRRLRLGPGLLTGMLGAGPPRALVFGKPARDPLLFRETVGEAAVELGVSFRLAEGKEGQGQEGGPGPCCGEEAGGQEGGQPLVREKAQEFWHW